MDVSMEQRVKTLHNDRSHGKTGYIRPRAPLDLYCSLFHDRHLASQAAATESVFPSLFPPRSHCCRRQACRLDHQNSEL